MNDTDKDSAPQGESPRLLLRRSEPQAEPSRPAAPAAEEPSLVRPPENEPEPLPPGLDEECAVSETHSQPIPKPAPARSSIHARTLSQLLQEARQERAMTIRQVHEKTKVSLVHIAALENGEYAKLPQAVYTRGYLRKICEELGVDPDEAVALYDKESGEGDSSLKAHLKSDSAATQASNPGGNMHKYATYAVVGAFAAALVIGLVVYFAKPRITVTEGYQVPLEDFHSGSVPKLPSFTLTPPN
ncbi:MAG: hypothetical protein RL095_1106 [Verrucomicrobiota bacterium]|jgi:transcriptional regulator with XRE-family HTH domain